MPNLRIKHIPPMFTNVTNETFPSPLSLPNSQIRRLPQRLSYPIQIPDVPQADCAAQFTNQLEVASSLNLCSLHKSDVIQSLAPVNSQIKYFFIYFLTVRRLHTSRIGRIPHYWTGLCPFHKSDISLSFGSQTTNETTFLSTLSQCLIHRSDPFHHQANGALFTDQTDSVFITNRPLPYSEIRLTSSLSPIDRCPIRRSDFFKFPSAIDHCPIYRSD